MICQICGKDIIVNHIKQHVTKIHNISPKEYYNLYIKKENEGLCKMWK